MQSKIQKGDSIIAFHENLYTVIARSEATKQSQQGSQTTPRDCFANARNDNLLMKRYTIIMKKVAINGLGRIGWLVLRHYLSNRPDNVENVAAK